VIDQRRAARLHGPGEQLCQFAFGAATPLVRRPVDHLRVFPAHYDHCDERGLHQAFSCWDKVHVIPLWHGADYFARVPGLRALYVRYENWALAGGHGNLATHYVVAARKRGNEN
jgi:hypothetical protein